MSPTKITSVPPGSARVLEFPRRNHASGKVRIGETFAAMEAASRRHRAGIDVVSWYHDDAIARENSAAGGETPADATQAALAPDSLSSSR